MRMTRHCRAVALALTLLVIGAGCSSSDSGDGSESPEPSPAESPTARSERLTRVSEGPYELVMIAGDAPVNGIFDPSVEYAPDGTGWMVYSAVFGDLVPFGPYVETHLARSDDQGASWQYVTTINTAFDDQFERPDGTAMEGNWNYEVSSLVYDASDLGREWKLFSHRTFGCPSCPALTQPQFSWVVYRHASAAEGPADGWSTEEALFGSAQIPLAPFEGLPRVNLNQLHADLARNAVYSEPGAISAEGTLYLSLTALTNSPQALILLASDDGADTWRYVGTLADTADAEGLGFETFDGSSLVEVEGRLYLFASPKRGGEYTGTYVIEITDIARAELARDETGRLLPEVYFNPDQAIWERGGHNAGEADYDEENTGGGVIFPQIDVRALPALFQFSNTHVTLGAAPID